ncbi:MAG TPA: helix-turn-helix transcriptional regulator [Terriglobia bacterium]|nr:helix-turn-helix transcriptional regulator [Terriglobia bacterium]
MDRDRGIETLLPLRPVEFHVLLSLADGDRHGYGIMQDAKERGEAVPDVGTLYRALARMVDQGWIEAAVSKSDRNADDERRNYYRITALGLKVAKAEARRLEALTNAARLGGLLAKGER